MQPVSSDVVSLADLIQVACANRRRARVRLSAGDRVGVLHVADGEVVHASFGGLEGNAAVYAAVTVLGLIYQVDPEVFAPWRNVNGATSQLLLEAARLSDEGWTPVTTGSYDVRDSGPVRVATARGDTLPPPVSPPPRRSRGGLLAASALVVAAIAGIAVAFALRRAPAAAPAAVSSSVAAAAPATPGGPDAAVVDAAELTGPGDEPPRLLEGAPAPRPAVDLALSPTIVCRLRVDAGGAVAEARVFRSRLDLAAFEDAALTVVAHYRFRPARRRGEPVAAWVNWPVTFRDTGTATTLHMKGSDTIGGSLGPALARAFEQRRSDLHIDIEALGSSTAFVGLFDGSADLGASSRPVNASEMAEAQRLGVRLSEIVIGYDGLAVIVNPANPIASLSIDDASRLFRGEVHSWKELGGADRPVHRFSRPSYSGTYEFFRDKVIRRGDAKAPGELAADARIVEANKDIVAAVAADPSAVGYVGLGWATPEVRPVPLRAGAAGKPIAPTLATVRDGTYPVYRTLLVYTRGAPRGDAAAFLAFVVSPAGQALVEAHGFVAPGPGADAELAAIASSSPAETAPSAPDLVARIEFEARSSLVSASARAQLRQVAQQARRDGQHLLVLGNADAEGAPASAEPLSAARARAVAEVLRASGVPSNALSVDAAGSTRPLETNTTRAGRSHNRRVDVFVTR